MRVGLTAAGRERESGERKLEGCRAVHDKESRRAPSLSRSLGRAFFFFFLASSVRRGPLLRLVLPSTSSSASCHLVLRSSPFSSKTKTQKKQQQPPPSPRRRRRPPSPSLPPPPPPPLQAARPRPPPPGRDKGSRALRRRQRRRLLPRPRPLLPPPQGAAAAAAAAAAPGAASTPACAAWRPRTTPTCTGSTLWPRGSRRGTRAGWRGSTRIIAAAATAAATAGTRKMFRKKIPSPLYLPFSHSPFNQHTRERQPNEDSRTRALRKLQKYAPPLKKKASFQPPLSHRSVSFALFPALQKNENKKTREKIQRGGGPHSSPSFFFSLFHLLPFPSSSPSALCSRGEAGETRIKKCSCKKKKNKTKKNVLLVLTLHDCSIEKKGPPSL